MEKDFELERLKNLFNHGFPLATLKTTEDAYQRAFSLSSMAPPVLISVEKHLAYLPYIDSLTSFFQQNPLFWMLPFTTSDPTQVFGFYFRSVSQKEFRVYTPKKSLQSVLGWTTFQNYTFGTPIVLTEGVKELAVLEQGFSFPVLACLSLSISQGFLYFLSKHTRTLILAFDNDDAGKSAIRRITRQAGKVGIQCDGFLPKKPGEDWGDYLSHIDRANQHIRYTFQKY